MRNKKSGSHTDMDNIKWILSVCGRTKWLVAIEIVLKISISAILVGYSVLLKSLVDYAVAKDYAQFKVFAIILALMAVANQVISYVARYLEVYAASSIAIKIKQRLFKLIMDKDYASITAKHTGDWSTRLTTDATTIADALAVSIPKVAGMAAQLVLAIAAIILEIPVFAVVIIPGGVVVFAFSAFFKGKLKKLHKKIQEADAAYRVVVQENLGSMQIIHSYGREEVVEQQALAKMKLHRKARMVRNKFANICSTGYGSAISLAKLFASIYCGWLIIQGKMSYGAFTKISALVAQIQAPLSNMSGFLPIYYGMIASAERIRETETLADDRPNGLYEPEYVNKFYAEQFTGFKLKNVTFTYKARNEEEMPLVIRNLDMDVDKGDCVAFTGHSGCGKSTVLKLLMCLYQLDSGERVIKTKNGEVELTSQWRRLFAYVPQGNQLMSGTIREIISFGDKEIMADEARLEKAIKIACADFIYDLDDGLETRLGERGAGLSEGQMQRVAVARAIIADSPVLLFDESTSSLDEATEAKLLSNIQSMTDKTVFFVTHRPAALAISNKIMDFSKVNPEN